MNLYQKMAAIRKMCEVIKKDAKGYGYKYASIEEILPRVTAGMQKYSVSLLPNFVLDSTRIEPIHYMKTKVTKDGNVYEENVNEMLFSGNIIYTWVNDEDPTERIDVHWFITGSQADPSQAFGGALTYGLRYFYKQYFQIATPDDDPDSYRTKQKAAEEEEAKTIAAGITRQIDIIVKRYLAAHQGEEESVSKFIKDHNSEKGTPSARYDKITDPVIASKLLKKIAEEYGEVTED